MRKGINIAGDVHISLAGIFKCLACRLHTERLMLPGSCCCTAGFIYSTSQRAQQGAAGAGAPAGYRSSPGRGTAQVQGGTASQQQERMAAASNFFSSFMGQAPLGARSEQRGAAAGPAGHAGGRAAGGEAAGQGGQGSSWESKGKAYKLSG